MKIKESEIKAIFDEVASELSGIFEQEKEKLAKSIPGGAEESSSSDEGSKSAIPEGSSSEGSSSSDEGSKGSDDSSVPPPPAATPAASPSPAVSPSAAPPAVPPVADPAAPAVDAAPVTPEVLHAEYLKMMQEDPAQFAMHVQALDAVKAATAGASLSPAAPVAPPVAAPTDTLKAELPASPERAGGAKVEAVHKSEDVSRFEGLMKSYEVKVAELEAKLKTQADEQVAVQQVLTRIVERPMRKSIESIAQVAAPVKAVDLSKMSKESVSKHLCNVARTNLKKSDRSLINEFYTGTAKLEQLAHLFEEVK
jgi:hypothetical protein